MRVAIMILLHEGTQEARASAAFMMWRPLEMRKIRGKSFDLFDLIRWNWCGVNEEQTKQKPFDLAN